MTGKKVQCLSHTPLMGLHDPDSTMVQATEKALDSLKLELERFDPELIILFAPDHFNGFFYDLMPSFCLGVAAQAIGDYGTPSGPLAIPRKLAEGCIEAILAAEVDCAVSYRMQIDHGFAQPLQLLAGSLQRYPVIPIFINSVAPPLPSFKRARLLGEAVGKYTSTLNQRVLFMGSGGLSHNPPIPSLEDAAPDVAERLIAGRNLGEEARKLRQHHVVKAAQGFSSGASSLPPLNPEWDRRFLQALEEKDFDFLESLTNEEVTQAAGGSAHEVKSWVAANAAMFAATNGDYEVSAEFYKPIPEWIAGFATLQGNSLSRA